MPGPSMERGTDRIHVCPRCGELVDDYGPQSYCRPCWRAYRREYNARRRRARLGGSLAEIGTARPDRLRMLAEALVDRFGGFDRTAAEIVAYVLRWHGRK